MIQLFLVFLAGAAHALAFAPHPLALWLLAPLQVVMLGVLAAAVWRAPSVRRAAALGLVFGTGSFALGLYWIFISLHVYGQMAVPLAAAAVVLLAVGLAGLTALAAAVARWLAGPCAGWLFLPAWAGAWSGAEWLRGTLFTGFPWLNIGYGHVDSPLAGWAPVLGVYGVAMMASLVSAALAGLVLWRGRARVAALAAAAIPVISGMALQPLSWNVEPYGRPLALRLVQGNVAQSNKFDPDLILDALEMHLDLAGRPSLVPGFTPDLVVLPETAIPVFQDQLPPHLWQPWIDVAQRLNTTLATGIALHTPGPDGQSVFSNSVIGFDGAINPSDLINARVPWRYDKSHLVPFGEFVPTGFRWFVNAMIMPMGDFNRGAVRQQPFAIADQHVAFNICYEDVFGEELLPALHPGADGEPGASILANVSNLGWFGDSWALPQHLQIARMRSIETGRPSIRATNTGVTGVIDPKGVLQAYLPTHERGVLDTIVQGTTGFTPYARWGNLAVLVLTLLLLAIPATARYRRKSR